ncbi:MAG: YceD family protein, partial [Thermoanaerobaculia bacterium]
MAAVIIQLDRIREQPFRWREQRSIPAASLDRSEVLGLSEISWGGTVAPASPGHRLLARIDYEQTLACTRCLAPVAQQVAAEVDLIVVVQPSQPTVGELRLGEGDLGVLAVDEPELDTDPILMEQLQLNVPMSLLCRPDCAGLCPRCGADRNLEPNCCSAD